ncbi:MAG: ribonuclease P protein component [Candidatus Portnoybacteria bacterium]
MLSREFKLKKDNDFKKVFEKGRYFQKSFIKIKYLENNFEKNRFGIMVGTKVSKKAVKRNRIKRWLEEAIRLNLNQIKTGFDIVVMVNPEILDKKYQEIKQEFIHLLKESKLIQKNGSNN